VRERSARHDSVTRLQQAGFRAQPVDLRAADAANARSVPQRHHRHRVVAAFTALRDEIDPAIAAISTLMTATSFMLVLIASTRKKKSA